MESDEPVTRGHPFTCYLADDLPQDLRALKRHTGKSMSKLVGEAIEMLMRERVRRMEPTTIYAERLIARYGRRDAL